MQLLFQLPVSARIRHVLAAWLPTTERIHSISF